MNDQQKIREQLIALLKGGGAHATLRDALADLPTALRHQRPEGIPYSVWELVEHMRIAQYDIVEFSRNPDYVSPKWPEGYWPDKNKTLTEEIWQGTLSHIKADHQAMTDMVTNAENDLLEPFAHGNGQSLFREALLLADHNAYHIGQVILVRRLLNAWKG